MNKVLILLLLSVIVWAADVPWQVQLNRYAAEPLGAGNGGLVNLPNGFDPLAAHTWKIRWSLTAIDYYVDNTLLGTSTDHIAQGPMQANVITWAPASDWPAAFNAVLQPANTASQNQSYVASVTNVTVTTTATPELGSWALMLACASAVALRRKQRS